MSAPPSTLSWLAQTSLKSVTDKLLEAAPRLAILFGLLIGAVMLGCIVVYFIRKRSLDESTTHGALSLTLSEVRRMRREGRIDDDEMQRLKKIVTTQVRGELEPTPVEETPEETEDTEAPEPETPAEDDATPPEKKA